MIVAVVRLGPQFRVPICGFDGNRLSRLDSEDVVVCCVRHHVGVDTFDGTEGVLEPP